MFSKSSVQNKCIHDIHDGKLHKRYLTEYANVLSYNGSTDGAPLGHKTNRSIWPLSFILNDIPANIRFKYVLLGGIMIVEHEPSHDLTNLYLESFVEQTTELQENGILLRNINDSSEMLLKPTILCFSTDSVARPLLQFRLKFNGYFGCSYCYQKGTFIRTMRYPFEDESSEMRTHESYI